MYFNDYFKNGRGRPDGPKRVMDWQDWVYTLPLEASLISLSIWAAWGTHRLWHLGLLADVVVFAIVLMVLTIVSIRVLLIVFPPTEGRFTRIDNPEVIYIWGLIDFLMMNNLFLFYQVNLFPVVLRKFFCRLLGANMGNGLISIGGAIIAPYLVTIEQEGLIAQMPGSLRTQLRKECWSAAVSR